MDILNISIEDGKIVVKAKSNKFDPKTTPRIKITTKDVRKHLEGEGFLIEECMRGAELNNSDGSKLSATWIFSKKAIPKPKPKKPAAKKTSRRRTTKKATTEKKVVDNSSKDVILPIEEEKPAPKKRKSRAKKKTTK